GGLDALAHVGASRSPVAAKASSVLPDTVPVFAPSRPDAEDCELFLDARFPRCALATRARVPTKAALVHSGPVPDKACLRPSWFGPSQDGLPPKPVHGYLVPAHRRKPLA